MIRLQLRNPRARVVSNRANGFEQGIHVHGETSRPVRCYAREVLLRDEDLVEELRARVRAWRDGGSRDGPRTGLEHALAAVEHVPLYLVSVSRDRSRA
jgi:hypothetical protein